MEKRVRPIVNSSGNMPIQANKKHAGSIRVEDPHNSAVVNIPHNMADRGESQSSVTTVVYSQKNPCPDLDPQAQAQKRAKISYQSDSRRGGEID